jgi:hypothetical protein
MSDENNAVDGIQPSPYRDRVDPKVADQTTSSSAQSLNLDGLRDLSALSKLQVREFTHTGATQMQATSNAMTQMAAAGAKAVNYIMDGGK